MADDSAPDARNRLLARGRNLEYVTLEWNLVGIVVLTIAAVSARSVALAGFGLDSFIEIGASTVVLWELADVAALRQRLAVRLIGGAFVVLALYLTAQSTSFNLVHQPLLYLVRGEPTDPVGAEAGEDVLVQVAEISLLRRRREATRQGEEFSRPRLERELCAAWIEPAAPLDVDLHLS